MSKLLISSGLSDAAIANLTHGEFEILDFHYNPAVGKNIAHHADISFLDCCDGTVFAAREMSEYVCVIKSYGYNVQIISEHLGKAYPNDVLLNCVPMGEFLICNTDTVSQTVLHHFKNKKIINVRQGYTKCSVIPVNGNALITDDESIANECTLNGIDVLKVSKGSVCLPGFNYGFIGGTAGKISDNQIAFNGDISTHADHFEIINFLSKYKIKAVSLCSGPLLDIGSLIVLKRRNLNEEK